MLHVAASDLGQSMGNPGTAAVRRQMSEVITRIRAAGKLVGVGGNNPGDVAGVAEFIKLGANFVTVSSLGLLRLGAEDFARRLTLFYRDDGAPLSRGKRGLDARTGESVYHVDNSERRLTMRQLRRRLAIGVVLTVVAMVGRDLPGEADCRGSRRLSARYSVSVGGLGPAAWSSPEPSRRGLTVRSSMLGTESQRMYVRAQPDSARFPVRVCETILAPGTTSAAVEGHALPMPRHNPRRIVVIGDTGCRLKEPRAFQACHDAQAWPFARIARSAARWQPDLVIHVGDNLYREAPCPVGNAGCVGSPWGDNWRTWEADFFAPAAELLRAAPWVVARGNHEVCSRSGYGWFRFLDPQFPALGCQHYTPPYRVPLGDLQLLDARHGQCAGRPPPAGIVAFYAAQFEALRPSRRQPCLARHTPPHLGGRSVGRCPEGRYPVSNQCNLAGGLEQWPWRTYQACALGASCICSRS